MSPLAQHLHNEYSKTKRDISFKAWLATLPETEKVAEFLKNKSIARGAARVMRKDKPIYVKNRKKKSGTKPTTTTKGKGKTD